MMKNNYFIYCLERPISYSTSKTDPYSKDGKIYCHGTRSRIHLIPTDLVSVMDVPMLSSHKNKYKQAMKTCGLFTRNENENDDDNENENKNHNTDNDDDNDDNDDDSNDNKDNEDKFIKTLRAIRSGYQQQIVKLQKHRMNGHVKYK